MAGRTRRKEVGTKLEWSEDDLEVCFVNAYVGRGLFTKRTFKAGEIITEYCGDLIHEDEAVTREESSPVHADYMFAFKHDGQMWCIDAFHDESKSRFINDASSRSANAFVKKHVIDEVPRLFIYAKRKIPCGTEIRYDYGDPSAEWRKKEWVADKHEGLNGPSREVNTPGGNDIPEAPLAAGERGAPGSRSSSDSAVSLPGGGISTQEPSDGGINVPVDAHGELFDDDMEVGLDAHGEPDVLLEGLHVELKKSVSLEKPDSLNCCRVLADIDELPLTFTLLEKHAEFLQTLKKIRRYKYSDDVRQKAGSLFLKLRRICTDGMTMEEEPSERDIEVTVDVHREPSERDIEAPVDVHREPSERDIEVPVDVHREPSERDIEVTVDVHREPSERDIEAPVDVHREKDNDRNNLRDLLQKQKEEIESLRAKLAESYAINASLSKTRATNSLPTVIGQSPSTSVSASQISAAGCCGSSPSGPIEAVRRSRPSNRRTRKTNRSPSSSDSSGPSRKKPAQESCDHNEDHQADLCYENEDRSSCCGNSDDETTRSEYKPGDAVTENDTDDDTDVYYNMEHDDSESDTPQDEIIPEKSNPRVYIRKVLSSSTSKAGKKKRQERVYNTRHCCCFCDKLFVNYSQHLLGKAHQDEPAVIEIAQLAVNPRDSRETKQEKVKERKRLIAILRNRGDNSHNKSVLEREKGEVILSRRVTDDTFNVAEFGPCSNCLEWLKLDTMPRHQSTCVGSPSGSETKGNLIIKSMVISGRLKTEPSSLVLKEVFPIMARNQIGNIAMTDPLIVALGNQWMYKNIRNRLMRRYYVSATMRLSARLLLALRELDDPPTTGVDMEDFIDPGFMSKFVKATMIVAGQDEGSEEEMTAPSNALKLAYDIKRLANIKLGKAIELKDTVKKEAAKSFLELMSIQWNTSLERMILEEKHCERKRPLPLPSDIVNFNKHLTEQAAACSFTDSSYKNYRAIVIVALAMLIAYNRRRPGEVQSMPLKKYASRKRGSDELTTAVTRDMSDLEKKVLLDQEVMLVRGKCGKSVPVIIPTAIKPHLAWISDPERRKDAGISSTNPYIFANNKTGVIRGGYAIGVMKESAHLQHPERIRATDMRRYMATMCQGLNISDQQLRWIVHHLGHTLDVHEIHYRGVLDVIERVDIAKIMLMLDTGTISCFKNRKLEDIRLEEIFQMEDAAGGGAESIAMVDSEAEEEYCPDIPIDEDDSFSMSDRRKKRKKPAPALKRHKWSTSELKEIKMLFSDFFTRNKTPGESAVKKAMSQSKTNGGTLWKLAPKSIKSKVSWMRLHKKGASN